MLIKHNYTPEYSATFYQRVPVIIITWIMFSILFQTTAFCKNSLETVTLQLAWKHQFQFAGYYAALHKGYYEVAGLDVKINEGGEGKFAREEVLSNRAQYGIAGAELLLHKAEGEPFVVLAPIFQHSPSVLITRADSGISNPQQLIGKRVMMLPENKDADILAVLLNENVSLDSIERLDQSYNINDLIEGKTDAVTAYLTNEPWHMQQLGVRANIIRPSTYGVDFYSDCLFTTDSEAKKHPERVRSFLTASIKGWEYAMQHTEELVDIIILEYGVSKTREHLLFEAEAIRGIMLPDLIEIGHMNPGRWRHIANTYARLGMLQPSYPIDEFIYNLNPENDYRWMRWALIFLAPATIIFTVISISLLYLTKKLQKEIKERKKVENAYRESRREISTLLANLPGIAFRCKNKENQWTMVYISEGVYSLTGYTPDELINSDVMTFKEIIHPDDRKMVGKHITSAIEQQLPYELEYRIITKDNKEKNLFEKGIQIFSDTGEPMFIEGFISDITQRVLDQKEKTSLEIQLHQSRKMESIGTLAGGIAHDFNNIMGIILGNAELAMMNIYPHSYLDSTRNNKNDIDGRKSFQKSTFGSSDIDTNQLQHYHEESNRDYLYEIHTIEQNLNEIKTACLRAKEVVRQLLDFARKSDPIQIEIQLNSVITDALKLLRSSLPATIDIKFNLAEKSPTILADPTQMSQIIINLCANATHAMPDGGLLQIISGSVNLEHKSHFKKSMEKGEEKNDKQLTRKNIAEMFRDLPEQKYAILIIKDTGHGISEENIDRIFDPYFTTKPVNEGSGFGLAVVHGIVRQHKGGISVASREGEGSTFTILLPLAEPTIEHNIEPEIYMANEKRAEKKDFSEGNSENVTILFVDDEASIAEIGKEVLERSGYTVTTKTDPLEALEKFRENPDGFDLLITDMAMPGMSGNQLISAIQKIRPELPVILSTGYASGSQDEKKGKFHKDIDAFLSKPHEFHELIKTVQRVISSKRI
ncbi:putative Two domain sensory box histidine kinase (PAS/PAC domain/GGDEF domain protein) [Desulfamplus magnetovallimortis]|uniref:histidine kinase n=1 Tax=Desulfamplus magnetovallimortis TaxID=1246637 RepID=A0A1W1HFW5_9BACT|nr:ABC transporter substrate-binding protein [Desulfamplus magnetovallimortis]SLM31282.1 putative Two domain sensory box histidine kinase (PAS/PAC domain/GGDEF domain protein) [Desulfamplus magnetovallimortis]